ncbi:MAG: hypothetical protein AAGI66_00315 [Cyanobacteria bacterium P01_H01_bin.74]
MKPVQMPIVKGLILKSLILKGLVSLVAVFMLSSKGFTAPSRQPAMPGEIGIQANTRIQASKSALTSAYAAQVPAGLLKAQTNATEILMADGILEKKTDSTKNQAFTTPVSRATWAVMLCKTLGHNLNLVSEFPFYRDVDLNHWAYRAIEVSREKTLIDYPDEHGLYSPDTPVTLGQVFTGLSNAITGQLPSKEETDYLLQPVASQKSENSSKMLAQPHAIAKDVRPHLAKMIRVRFFQFAYPDLTAAGNSIPFSLNTETPVSVYDLAPLLVGLKAINKSRTAVQQEKKEKILSTGLTLQVSPTTTIVEKELAVGNEIGFVTILPMTDQGQGNAFIIPKGTIIQGTISAEDPSLHNYTVSFTTLQMPDGKTMKMNANLVLRFNASTNKDFFVPGNTFAVITQNNTIQGAPNDSIGQN